MGTPDAPIAVMLPSWQFSLEGRGLSDNTLAVYARTGRIFTAWLEEHGLPTGTESVDAPHIRAFLAAEAQRTSAIRAHQHYRNLRVFFRWLAREGERAAPNPMERIEAPVVTVKVKGSLGDAELKALLKTCEGQGFEERRDTAIMLIFIDTGVRVSGLAGVRVAHVNLPHKTVKVTLKGGDEHLIPVGRKAAAALDRYIRARARHRHADSPWLWLGMAGRDPGHFGVAGIQDMLERRSRQAGLEKVTPHWFRRTFVRAWRDAGGNDGDAMRIAGWRTRAMLDHYAGDLEGAHARRAHARLSPGDRL